MAEDPDNPALRHKRNLNRDRRRWHVMRLLVERRDQPPVTTHFLKEELQRRVGMTLRDSDVRECLDELVELKWCDIHRYDESGLTFKINGDGISWWSRHGEAAGQLLMLMH